MSSWISVKDKLPELRKDVLIRVTVGDKYNVEQGRYYGSDWCNCWCATRNENLYPVTHWQPLPDEPKDD